MKKILIVLGPTASGKSALAVKLARKFNGEIISADSRQVYKGLDIGTGKITKKEMVGIPHHLLDVANPKKQFTVADFQRIARKKIAEIFSRGHLPIICGGTGFYISSLVDGIVLPDVPPNKKLRANLSKKTPETLLGMLLKLEPQRAKTVDAKNPRRLIRAIEIATAQGFVPPLRSDLSPDPKVGPWHTLLIGLSPSPEELKKKIAIRLFARIRKGMVAEAKQLHEQGLSWKRMEELGLEYRYLAYYLQNKIWLRPIPAASGRGIRRGIGANFVVDESAPPTHLSSCGFIPADSRRGILRGYNKITKQEMTEKLQTEIWRYAKRQMTWFKRNKQIQWFRPNEIRKIKTKVKKFLA